VSFTRRVLLLGLVAAPGLDPPRLLKWLGGRGRGFSATAAAAAEPAPELTAPEIDDLIAFAEVLVEGRPLSADERKVLVDHIEYRITQGGGYYLELYRTTAQLVNRLARAQFSSLDVAGRIAVMTRNRLTSPNVLPEEQRGGISDDTRAVRTRAVPDLIGGYYGSDVGWAAVGYDTFPGRCGDLARYTNPER